MDISFASDIISISCNHKDVSISLARWEETIRYVDGIDTEDIFWNRADIVGPLEIVVEFMSDSL
jgi:hypothetical protein